jgi:hypothetical protein
VPQAIDLIEVSKPSERAIAIRDYFAMKFEIFLPESVHAEPITGRLFLIPPRNGDSEPRMQLFDLPVFATGVSELAPGITAVIDAATPG